MIDMNVKALAASLGFAALLVSAGCASDSSAATDGSPAAAANSSKSKVTPTGVVHEVRMLSGRGELFEPAELTVKQGDLVRFVLGAGVHNASFPKDQNPSGIELPEATPYLQIPGQAHDMLVELPAGEYNFHCDPHAALGMIGKLTVAP
jgi:plastocyanin